MYEMSFSKRMVMNVKVIVCFSFWVLVWLLDEVLVCWLCDNLCVGFLKFDIVDIGRVFEVVFLFFFLWMFFIVL